MSGHTPGHSAHVGQEVVVHYRWHPLFGRRLRQHYSEDRRTGRIVHVETAPGVVVALAAWMLDPVACAGMELGPPCVSIPAIVALDDLLTELGLRPSSPCDAIVAEEEHDDRPEDMGAACAVPPTDDDIRFRKAARDERRRTPNRGDDARGAVGRGCDAGNGRRR